MANNSTIFMMPPPDDGPTIPMMGAPDSPVPSHKQPTSNTVPMMPAPDGEPSETSKENESNWVELKRDGLTFYYNYKYEVSLWEKPPSFVTSGRPRPIFAEQIGDTLWHKIYLSSYQSYFYHKKTKKSQWSIPDEISDIVKSMQTKKEEEKNKQKEEIDRIEANKRKLEEKQLSKEESKRQKVTNEKEEASEYSDEDDEEDDNEEEDDSEDEEKTEQSNEKKEVTQTIEEKIEIFLQMLREKQIAPFTTWEKILPKLAFDPRFKIIPDVQERKAIFERYMKTRVDDEIAEKKSRYTGVKDQCKELVDNGTCAIKHDTSFDQFKDLFKEQLKQLTTKEKEKLYNEMLEPLKKQAKEESNNTKDKATDDFKALLKETKDVNMNAVWSKIKRTIEKDPRFKNKMLDLEDKEKIFEDYVAQLKKDEQDKKKKREEASLREREKEVARIKQVENEERNRALNKIKEEERDREYKILLKEKVRDPEASWTRTRRVLEGDPRFSDRLSIDAKERIFREHCKMLQEELEQSFKNMLYEFSERGIITVATKDLTGVKDQLREDPRYDKIRKEDRDYLFKDFMRDLKKDAWDDFRALLKDSKSAGYISRLTPTSGQKFDHFKELVQIDKRYKRMDPFPEERDRVIVEFIEKLRKDNESQNKK